MLELAEREKKIVIITIFPVFKTCTRNIEHIKLREKIPKLNFRNKKCLRHCGKKY